MIQTQGRSLFLFTITISLTRKQQQEEVEEEEEERLIRLFAHVYYKYALDDLRSKTKQKKKTVSWLFEQTQSACCSRRERTIK
jgi:hypothetical protein